MLNRETNARENFVVVSATKTKYRLNSLAIKSLKKYWNVRKIVGWIRVGF